LSHNSPLSYDSPPCSLVLSSQKISGLNAEKAEASEAFKRSFIRAVAKVLKVEGKTVRIVSITDVTDFRRQLTIVNYNGTLIDVLYEVTSGSMDMKSVSTALASATSSGEFTTSLQSDLAAEGANDIQVSASLSPMVIDVSPTSEPTYAPSRAPIIGTYAPTPLPTLEITQVN
jgi:hypothetical protein